jgi:hypothetical protein
MTHPARARVSQTGNHSNGAQPYQGDRLNTLKHRHFSPSFPGPATQPYDPDHKLFNSLLARR